MRSASTIMIVIAIVLACAYAALCGYLYFTQRSHLYFPQPRINDSVPAMRMQRDGVDLIVSMQPQDGKDAILYFGGNAEDVSQDVPSLVEAFPGKAIYALHYRGFGGSGGAPTEKDLIGDGMALFDLVYAKHKDVTVIGRSLGSGVAVQVAAQRPAVRLVLVTPYNSIAEVAAVQFWFVPVNWLLKDRFDSWKFAPRISVPTTVIAAENDETIPMSSTRALFTHFKPGIASFVIIRDAGHNDVSQASGYMEALRGGRR